jgi:imidazolonepropionase-like amidohydrolase
VGFGLSPEEALKALTINPAQIWGVDKDLGSLEVGKMGNVVVWWPTEIRWTLRQT